MNKQQREELEDMVRQLAEEPYNPSEAHIEEIKRQAFEEYDQIMAAKQKMKEKRKGTLRRVVVTAAAIICLLVGSTVIALLNPLQSGNADNFFRRAVIWVNDQLHLGIEFAVPDEEKKNAFFNNGEEIESIQEAAKSLNMCIVCLMGNEDLVLEGIDYNVDSFTNEKIVTLRYKINNASISIVTKTGMDYNTISINSKAVKKIETSVGEIVLLETGDSVRGVVIYENVYAILSNTMSMDDFTDYCKYLYVFN